MHRRVIAAAAGLVLALSVVSAAQSSTPQVLSPSAKHFGKTYPQWSSRWWQWALSIPVHSPPLGKKINHPLVDLTGARCGVGQSGPVWFLGAAFFQNGTPAASTIVRNDCVVPEEKALFFPVLNIECSQLEGSAFGCGATEQESRNIVAAVIDQAANLAADVDGVALPISSRFRVGSPGKADFCFSLPKDDVLTFIGEGPFSPGTYCPAVDDGYYLMLAPLPEGPHTVHFHGEIPSFGFTIDVTYNLTVSD